ncbi:MAG: sugar phosphate isomerase/epimerase [Planctomycetaceae bacterium]|nr:sugar phosphate isomerase/epimerase [Planctomycetaceae bacterium]
MKISVINNGISSDFETCCKVLKETNIKYIEIQNVHNTPVECLPAEDAAGWKTICDRYGITPIIVTTHAFAGIAVGAVEVGDETYQKHMGLLKNGIAQARVLGAKMVRSMVFTKAIVTWGFHGADKWNAGGNTAWGKFIRLFEPIARLAEDEGIDIVVENGFNAMITSAYLTRKMIDELGSKRIKLLWDPCNALYYHEYPTVEVYESVRDIIGHIHIKDATIDSIKSEVDFRRIGTGMMAPYLTDLADALRRDGYDGYISLENVLRPDNGDFIDGYYQDIPELVRIFG